MICSNQIFLQNFYCVVKIQFHKRNFIRSVLQQHFIMVSLLSKDILHPRSVFSLKMQTVKTYGLIFPGCGADRSYRYDHICSLLSNGSRECSLPCVHQFRWLCFILELQPPQSWQIHFSVSILQPEENPTACRHCCCIE